MSGSKDFVMMQGRVNRVLYQEFREVVKEAEGKTIQYLLTQFLRSEIERVKRNKVVLNG